MALVWKGIKPARLKQDGLRLALLNEMRKAGTAIKKDFQKTTQTWETKPQFEVLVSLTQPGPTVLVDTDNEIYRYVNDGTRPHLIVPVRASRLAFQGTYTAKTVPGVLGSRSGGPSGDMVYAMAVNHPGTEARDFDEMIAEKWRSPFKTRMEKALSTWVKSSGHSI